MKLRTMQAWERIFPTKQIEHVYYTSDMLVRKVTGYIIVTKRTLVNGIVTNTARQKRVRWDGLADVITSITIPDCVITIYAS